MESRFAWGTRFLLARLKPKHRSKRALRGRVLGLLRGGLGDKLMAIPALRRFREESAGSEFTLVVEGLCPPFFECETDRLEIISANAPWRKAVIALRRFDACFVNSIGVFDIWSEIASFVSGAHDLRGPRSGNHTDADTVYSKPFAFGGTHETVVNFRGAGGVTGEATLAYPLQLPRSSSVADPGRRIVLHPGSSALGSVNRWSSENFAELGRKMSEYGFRVIGVGTESERELLRGIQGMSGGAVEPTIGLPLPELALLLAGASLVIANDSGIGHLAAAVGARLITIMGATRPANVGPVGSNVTILGPRCPRNGCYGELPAAECLRCVNLITSEEVLACAMQRVRDQTRSPVLSRGVA